MCKVRNCYGFVKVSLISGKASACYDFVKISLNPGKAGLRRLTRRMEQPELVRSSVPVPGPYAGGWELELGAVPETESFVKFLLNFLGAAVKLGLRLR